MSLADLFYPGNKILRENCVRLSQEIYDAMKNNFCATNDLVRVIRIKLRVNCSTVTLDHSKTVKENAATLKAKITEIQKKLDGELKKYRSRIDPHIYNKLFDNGLDLSEKFRYIKMGAKGIELIVSAIVTIRTSYLAIQYLTGSLVTIGSFGIGALVLGLLVVGDVIVSLIVGAKERDKLKETEEQLRHVVAKFVPASREYTKALQYVEYRLEDL